MTGVTDFRIRHSDRKISAAHKKPAEKNAAVGGTSLIKKIFSKMRIILLFVLFPFQVIAQDFSKAEINRWEEQARRVTIIRDNWGIPHIYGKTDADAAFGLLYAQCEDDFKRVEMN